MKLIILLFLVFIALAQQCPYCAPRSCILTRRGLSSCSRCSTGALVRVRPVVLPPLNPSAT